MPLLRALFLFPLLVFHNWYENNHIEVFPLLIWSFFLANRQPLDMEIDVNAIFLLKNVEG